MSEQNSDVDVIVEYDNHFISNVRIESEKPVKATNEFPAGTDNEKNQKQRSCFVRAWSILVKFSFFVGVICSLPIAYAFPSLGAEYLQPQITATWIAVVFVFLLAGLGIKSGEFSKSFQRIWFNLFVQSFNFFAVSSIVYGISRFLIVTNAVSKALGDGMVICSCLPMTINTVSVLTKSSGGDEAVAVLNAALGNMIGIFLTPALIFAYLGVRGDVDLFNVFIKLSLRVVIPVIVGQLLQKFVPVVLNFVKKYKPKFKICQEMCIVYIVYTVFCKTFQSESQIGVAESFIMIGFQILLLSGFMVFSWLILKLLFSAQPKLRVMGLFGCTHKTIAMGVPLINAIYEDDPNIAFYTLPILIWHPMQLIIGTALAPGLSNFVKEEERQLSLKTETDFGETPELP